MQPGGCPISRLQYKFDVAYLDDAARARLADDVKAIRLATYKDAPSREHLGFMIDDMPASPAIDGARDQIDLYGYLSLTLGALQVEMTRVDSQERELAALRTRLEALSSPSSRRCRRSSR